MPEGVSLYFYYHLLIYVWILKVLYINGIISFGRIYGQPAFFVFQSCHGKIPAYTVLVTPAIVFNSQQIAHKIEAAPYTFALAVHKTTFIFITGFSTQGVCMYFPLTLLESFEIGAIDGISPGRQLISLALTGCRLLHQR